MSEQNKTKLSDETSATEAQRRGRSKLRWVGMIFTGVGLGAIVTYLISATMSAKGPARRFRRRDNVVDDRNTGQDEASQILRNLRDRAFDASNEKLAVALGRPQEEVEAWNTGREQIDDDVIMKARGIAIHRGVNID